MTTIWFVIYIYGALAILAALGYAVYNLYLDNQEALADIDALVEENEYLRQLIIALDTVSMN